MSKTFSYNHMKFVEVVDGDTIRFMLDFGFGIFKSIDVRIASIDTPEKRTRKDPLERAAGKTVTKFTESMFREFESLNATYYMDVRDKPKYSGRCIGSLQISVPVTDFHWGSLLLGYAMALSYSGATKKKFTKKFLNNIIKLDKLTSEEYEAYIQGFFI